MDHLVNPNSENRFGDSIRKFLKLESSAGVLLMVAVLAAMAIKNSPASQYYINFLNLPGIVQVGALRLEKPLFLWVNDAWMAVFFLLVGMELKRELLYGYLSNRSELILPAAAAAGGIIVPAAVYLLLNADNGVAAQGWAIPTATDIAFALGVLSLLSSRVPLSLKVFLMTVAVIDDLAAIVVIALFYTSNLSFSAMSLAALFATLLIVINRAGVRGRAAYFIVGLALWICVLKSGVHATLAGVVVGLAIPGRLKPKDENSPLEDTIHKLHPWVAFAILPMFAFVNAGIAFEGMSFARVLEPIPLGIFLGLAVGKPVGVMVFASVILLLRLSSFPPHMNWTRLFGVALLCGVGFTMSIFVGSLAFQETDIGYARIDRLAILLASLVSSVAGYLVLRMATASK